MNAKKIVLVSLNGYQPRHDPMLEEFIRRQVHLFCAVGKQCELWEEVMDELCVGPTGDGKWLITTTSHPDESVEEVIAFAEQWTLPEPSKVEVVEV